MLHHQSPMNLKILVYIQSMTSSPRMLRLLFLFGFCWAMCTWLLVAYPYRDGFADPHSFSPPSTTTTTTTSSSVDAGEDFQRQVIVRQDDTFSACLLVMDDNHFLIEWLAYHYHTLPLRYLVVAVDPRSRTSPSPVLDRWRDKMIIVEWNDEDFMTERERTDAEGIVRSNFGNLTAPLVLHRARQRVFYYKCMKKLKEEHRTWVLMTDTDEFLRINVRKVKEANEQQPKQQDSNYQNINRLSTRIEEPASIRSLLNAELQRPNSNLSQSPCLQIPRLRFGAVDSGKPPMHRVPPGYDATNFLTLRWRKHAGPDQYWANRISKVLIDVSQVQWKELVPVESIHRPIKSLCSRRKLHVHTSDSVLVINHYLGSWEQYEYRDDARAKDDRFGEGRTRMQYDKLKKVEAETSDDIRPWLEGFVETMGENNAASLLDGVGILQPRESFPSSAFIPEYGESERCAILFFGLPRSFKDLVLPSLEKNLIGINARYNCDYFVHYFYRTEEPEGRANNGGKLDPTEILLLKEAVENSAASVLRKTHKNIPVVTFHADTEEDFWAARNDTIQKYRNAKDKNGKYLYFPWRAKTYHYPSSLDNIVRQWHSINGAWELMERYAAENGIHYSRVGMFRSDVFYVTEVDIYQTELGVYDSKNSQAMLAPFGALPVNDRMFYGPYEAVEIWATRRFSFLEKYVHTCEPGWAMHSEKFLDGAIMPAIRELGIAVVVNPDICFLRTRADFSAVTNDCRLLGMTRGFERRKMRSLVQQIIGRQCSASFRVTASHNAVQCEPPDLVTTE